MQQRGISGMVKTNIEEAKSSFERQVDRLVNEINGKIIGIVDQRV
jgi:hypothetical protein